MISENELNYYTFIMDKKDKEKQKSGFSNLNEEEIIEKYLNSLPLRGKYCVDIAASDGITMSNTLFLFKKGWQGLAVEFDHDSFSKLASLYKEFPDVSLLRTKVTPTNIISILKACSCPNNFDFLNFDIDGYDFFVLDQLLKEFRPSLICTEINEKIPPPISFSVNYSPKYSWGSDHFFGQSIAKCYELCSKYKYDIVELCYNNLFIIPNELNKFNQLSPEQAYKVDYKDQVDRREKFPWNYDMEGLLSMSKENGIEFLKNKFEKYNGKYILE